MKSKPKVIIRYQLWVETEYGCNPLGNRFFIGSKPGFTWPEKFVFSDIADAERNAEIAQQYLDKEKGKK